MEKGQELHDEQVRKVAHRFSASYKKWKAIIKDANQALSGQCSNKLPHEHISRVSKASKNLNAVYEELRHIPDHDTRHRVDTCEAVTKTVIKAARGRLNTGTDEGQGDEEQCVKETESVFRSAASDKISIRSHHTKSSVHSRSSSKIPSRHSSQSPAHRQAAAEFAANEATLQVLLEQEHHIEELKRLEAEASHVRTQQEAENAERKRVLEAERTITTTRDN